MFEVFSKFLPFLLTPPYVPGLAFPVAGREHLFLFPHVTEPQAGNASGLSRQKACGD